MPTYLSRRSASSKNSMQTNRSASSAAKADAWPKGALMNYVPKGFGRRQPRVFHGCIPVTARRRIHCTVIHRRNRVIYIDLRESFQIPFRFRIEFDNDGSWMDCEFKSQQGDVLVAQMITASFDEKENAESEVQPPRRADLDEVIRWLGRNK